MAAPPVVSGTRLTITPVRLNCVPPAPPAPPAPSAYNAVRAARAAVFLGRDTDEEDLVPRSRAERAKVLTDEVGQVLDPEYQLSDHLLQAFSCLVTRAAQPSVFAVSQSFGDDALKTGGATTTPTKALVSYCDGGHWVLLVVDASQRAWYIVDSLGGADAYSRDPAVLSLLERACRVLLSGSSRTVKPDRLRYTPCPFSDVLRQKDSVSCGAFVCAHMFRVATGKHLPGIEEPGIALPGVAQMVSGKRVRSAVFMTLRNFLLSPSNVVTRQR